MKALHKRLSTLEAQGGSVRWHRVLQSIGQSLDDALSAYEVCNGPVPARDNIIIRTVVRP